MKLVTKIVGKLVKWYFKLAIWCYVIIGLGGYFNRVEDEDEGGTTGWEMVMNAHARNWDDGINGFKRFWKNNFAKRES